MRVFPKFTRRMLLKSGSMSLIGLTLRDSVNPFPPDDVDKRHSHFVNPPDEARPWVYWYFMDGHLAPEGMAADLEAMKGAGIGGGIYLEVGIGIPPGPVRFMSEQWQQTIADAFGRADELGLEIALAAGAGWCGAGGPWVKPEESMQFLVTSETRVQGPGKFSGQLPIPKPRTPFFGEETLTPELRAIWEGFYIDSCVLAFPAPQGHAETADLAEKALYMRGSYSSQILGPNSTVPWVRPFLPSRAAYPQVAVRECVTQTRVQNLTSQMGKDGQLEWDIPEGDWILLRAGRRITAQTTRPAPIPGLGFETDKFSRAAVDNHFEAYCAKLLKRIGTRRHKASGLTTLHYDSWEMSSQNWTPDFPAQFKARRGYDLMPYLPTLAGYVVRDRATTERFLWDFRQTAQELVIENQAERLRELAQKHGLSFSLEPYDLDPCSDLELGRVADVPMAEFWSHFGEINSDWSVAESTSVGHTNGRAIIGAEAFTAEFPERWLQHPASMKNQGDWAFCAGINRIVFHRFQSQSGTDRSPGMTMGPDGGYGVHWDRTQTWWDMAHGYHRYVTRCSAMLRRGLFVADVLYLAAEGAPHVFLPPPSVFLPGEFPDRRGYNFDGCSPETLMARASVADGDVVFPDGMRYRLLVLPQVETMTPRLLKKVTELVEAGATVVGMPPTASPSLSDYPRCDAEVQELGARLWAGRHEGQAGSVGRGTVLHDSSAFRWAQENPLAQARWIWAAGSNEPGDNKGTRTFTRTFRVEGATYVEIAEVLITASPSYEVAVNGMRLGAGHVADQARRFDVTSLLVDGENEIRVTVDGSKDAGSLPFGMIAAVTHSGASGPSSSMVTDRSWQVTAGEDAAVEQAVEHGGFDAAPWKLTPASLQQASLYPPYRVTVRVLVGRGIEPDFVGEGVRAIHRRDGDEDLYFIANREDRENAVTCAFRVTGKQPEWWDPLTGERRALGDFAERNGRTFVPARLGPHESGFIVFRNDKASAVTKENFPAFTPVQTIEGAWDVSFDPRWGGPATARFDRLEDWTSRSESSIRYYSGKATYRISFQCGPAGTGRALFLSLWSVHNIASVRLNGRDLGVAWCAPWRVSLPADVLKTSENELEITVANLWQNRLIRDSGLAEEERLTWIPGKYPFQPGDPLRTSGLLGPVRIEARG
jgi:alpha-L-rhamnosidase